MEIVKNEELNPLNSGFRADTNLDVTATEFAVMSATIEQMFSENVKVVRPMRYRYYDVATGELVLTPTKEDFEAGKLKAEFDPLAFMNPGNVMEAYVGEVNQVVIQALQARFDIHDRGIKDGKAISNDVLISELEAKKAEIKPNLEIVND